MVEKKVENLKKLINDLDQQKLDNSYKIDSISLISQNLSRTKQYSIVKKSKHGQKQSPKVQTFTVLTPELNHSIYLKLGQKGVSTKESPQIHSPGRHLKTLNQNNKNRIVKFAKRLYEARTEDMCIKHTQTGWSEFLKTFTLKNSKNGEYIGEKIDLSGLNLYEKSLKVAMSILTEYERIDLSRNLIKCEDLLHIKNSKMIQELTLKNCGMKNDELCKLFEILKATNIKILNISSPDLKDRNNLTKYEELYSLIETAPSLECIQLSNIQVSPQCQIFTYVKKSKTLKRINLSKNTGVVGICKNIQDLNLSWNGIKKPFGLRCPDSNIIKLDLTGNLIPSHLFEQFLTTSNFPIIQSLTLNKIPISNEGAWLQGMIQKTKTLNSLSLVECELSKTTFLNVIYGLELNRTIKVLNLSNNKIPFEVAEHFAQSLEKCYVTHLYLQECDIKDECGAIIFKSLRKNKFIQFIDVSKNNLSQRTSETVCRCLKDSCYNLLSLITKQNFIKYDQLKEIVGYINRNIYMARLKIREQHKVYKNMNEGILETTKKLEQSEERLQQLREETDKISDEYMKKQRESSLMDAKIYEEQIRIMKQQQQLLSKKIAALQSQLNVLYGENLQEQVNEHHSDELNESH